MQQQVSQEQSAQQKFAAALKQADSGSARMQHYVAISYLKGSNGALKDVKEGLKRLQSAAEQAHVPAQRDLAMLYYQGRGVPRDYKQAFRLLMPSAHQGDDIAYVGLGICYKLGHGTPKNLRNAMRSFQAAANQQNGEGLHNLAVMYRDGTNEDDPDIQIAIRLFLAAARQGYSQSIEALKSLANTRQGKDKSQAQYALSQCYLHGWGIIKDLPQGTQLLEAAVGANNADALYSKAQLLQNQIVGEPKLICNAAVDLYVGAIAQGHKGAIKTIMEAITTAKQRGDINALIIWSQCQARGIPDREASIDLLLQAAELKDVRAYTTIRKQALEGYAYAQYALAKCYLHGFGTQKKPDSVWHWLQCAVDQGCSDAQYLLGWCYQYGKCNIRENLTIAFHLYSQAAEQGCLDGRNALEQLRTQGYTIVDGQVQLLQHRSAPSSSSLPSHSPAEQKSRDSKTAPVSAPMRSSIAAGGPPPLEPSSPPRGHDLSIPDLPPLVPAESIASQAERPAQVGLQPASVAVGSTQEASTPRKRKREQQPDDAKKPLFFSGLSSPIFFSSSLEGIEKELTQAINTPNFPQVAKIAAFIAANFPESANPMLTRSLELAAQLAAGKPTFDSLSILEILLVDKEELILGNEPFKSSIEKLRDVSSIEDSLLPQRQRILTQLQSQGLEIQQPQQSVKHEPIPKQEPGRGGP